MFVHVSRCLIYKVHALASRKRLGDSITSFVECQELFSFLFPSTRPPLPQRTSAFYHIRFLLSTPFFIFFRCGCCLLGELRCISECSDSIPISVRFVKPFFPFFSIYFVFLFPPQSLVSVSAVHPKKSKQQLPRRAPKFVP